MEQAVYHKAANQTVQQAQVQIAVCAAKMVEEYADDGEPCNSVDEFCGEKATEMIAGWNESNELLEGIGTLAAGGAIYKKRSKRNQSANQDPNLKSVNAQNIDVKNPINDAYSETKSTNMSSPSNNKFFFDGNGGLKPNLNFQSKVIVSQVEDKLKNFAKSSFRNVVSNGVKSSTIATAPSYQTNSSTSFISNEALYQSDNNNINNSYFEEMTSLCGDTARTGEELLEKQESMMEFIRVTSKK